MQQLRHEMPRSVVSGKSDGKQKHHVCRTRGVVGHTTHTFPSVAGGMVREPKQQLQKRVQNKNSRRNAEVCSSARIGE